MLVGAACEEVAYGAGAEVVAPFFSFASSCGGLSSVVATVVVVMEPQVVTLGEHLWHRCRLVRCSSEYHRVLLSLDQAGI